MPRIKKDSRVRFIDPRRFLSSSFPFFNLLLRLSSPLSKPGPSSLFPIRFSLTSVRDHVFPRRVTIKVEINFLIRFTLAWLFGDAGHAGDSTAPQGCSPLFSTPPLSRNLKFLIKVIADRGFLSASWISSPVVARPLSPRIV